MKQFFKLLNVQGQEISLQPSNLISVAAGDTTFPNKGYLKNVSGADVNVTIITAAGQEIATTIYKGWNPEIVIGVKGASANTLQFGF